MFRYTQLFMMPSSDDLSASINWQEVPTNHRGHKQWLQILYPLQIGFSIQFDNEKEFDMCGNNTKNLHKRLLCDNEPPRGFKSNRKNLTYTCIKPRRNQNATRYNSLIR